jgi:hypothetical protein
VLPLASTACQQGKIKQIHMLLIIHSQKVANQILSSKQENVFQNVTFKFCDLCQVFVLLKHHEN